MHEINAINNQRESRMGSGTSGNCIFNCLGTEPLQRQIAYQTLVHYPAVTTFFSWNIRITNFELGKASEEKQTRLTDPRLLAGSIHEYDYTDRFVFCFHWIAHLPGCLAIDAGRACLCFSGWGLGINWHSVSRKRAQKAVFTVLRWAWEYPC